MYVCMYVCVCVCVYWLMIGIGGGVVSESPTELFTALQYHRLVSAPLQETQWRSVGCVGESDLQLTPPVREEKVGVYTMPVNH